MTFLVLSDVPFPFCSRFARCSWEIKLFLFGLLELSSILVIEVFCHADSLDLCLSELCPSHTIFSLKIFLVICDRP